MRVLTFVFLMMACLNLCGQTFSESLVQKAQQGDAVAQLELAKCYDVGVGVECNDTLALYWYEKAAKGGSVSAMNACGVMLCNESRFDGRHPDFIEGIFWLRKAASKGDEDAKDILSYYTAGREEISRDCPDYTLPYELDLSADRYSMIISGESDIKEEYMRKNPTAAYYLAIIAFEKEKYKECMRYLNEAYQSLFKDGVFDKEANYRDLFEENNPLPHEDMSIEHKVPSLLGWCYEHGLGVQADYREAAKYYFVYIDQFGDPRTSQLRGAFCYKKAGLIDKFIEVANSTKVCIGRKVPCLQLELAEIYKNGEGVSKNPQKALEIYEEIVETRKELFADVWDFEGVCCSSLDIARAAYRASLMYRNGEGCKADKQMAELYYNLALKYGDKNAWYENQRNYEKNQK